MGILSWLRGDKSDEVLTQGLSVQQVVRELPYFTQPGNRYDHLEPRDCFRYSVPRVSSSGPSQWSMVQRDKEHGAQFENGWKFVSNEPQVPAPNDQLREALARMARELDDGVLEFEASREEVIIYAHEDCGKRWERRIHAYLTELSKL